MNSDYKSDNTNRKHKSMDKSRSSSQLAEEPLFQSQPNRYVILPIEHHDIWDMYKKQVASFWTVEEVEKTLDEGGVQSLGVLSMLLLGLRCLK